MIQYRTKQGDMLDAICFKHYGRESAEVDVLKANPGLADRGVVYPAGIIIDLPVLAASIASESPIRLWN